MNAACTIAALFLSLCDFDEVRITATDEAGHRHVNLRALVGCGLSRRQGGKSLPKTLHADDPLLAVKLWPVAPCDTPDACQEACAGKLWVRLSLVDALEITARAED